MSVSLLGFGDDITKVRNELAINIELLRSPEIKAELFARAKKWLFKPDPEKPEEKGIDKDLYLEFIYQKILFEVLYAVKNIPYLVNPAAIAVIEYLYIFENFGKVLEHPNEFKYLKGLEKKLERLRFQFLADLLSEEDNPSAEDISNKWGQQMSPNSPDFDYYFAFTLRQISPLQVRSFLYKQTNLWTSASTFLQFLKVVLLDYKDIIPEKNQILAKEFIQEVYNKARAARTQKENISPTPPPQTDKSYDTNTFSEAPFSKPPFDYFEIPGRLKPRDIRKFFSFLWLEDNGADTPFTKDQKLIEHLLTYGLQVPLEPLNKKFELDLAPSKKTKTIVYHCFYLLYVKHVRNQAHKQYFAQFLRHTFSNFENSNPNSFSSNLRDHNLTPRQLRFNIKEYLGDN